MISQYIAKMKSVHDTGWMKKKFKNKKSKKKKKGK